MDSIVPTHCDLALSTPLLFASFSYTEPPAPRCKVRVDKQIDSRTRYTAILHNDVFLPPYNCLPAHKSDIHQTDSQSVARQPDVGFGGKSFHS